MADREQERLIGGSRMLISLHVKNFAIIEEEEVFFGDNLNILTGETGAGKSIIIGSINACLGGKVSKEIVRKGAPYAFAELNFHTDDLKILTKLSELDLTCEDGEIIISRRIMANGRSSAKVNGETVTAAVLKEISALLIDIHGQHEHQSLLDKAMHLKLLDRYAREETGESKTKVREYYEEYTAIRKELSSSEMDEEKRLRELSFLDYAINEIESARLVIGEDEELTARHRLLSNAASIAEGMGTVYRLTGEDDGAADKLGRAVRQMSRIAEYDTELSSLLEQASEIEGLMNDFNREVSEYIDNLSDSGEELAEVEERLDLIERLKQKYGPETGDVLVYLKESRKKRDRLADYDAYLDGLRKKAAAAEKNLKAASGKLSELRRKKAIVLTETLKKALIDLNFLDVRFEMVFSVKNYTAEGIDDVEFFISTNPGEELRPLSKVASGGELSRIMLAIKSVLADKDEIETLIFDEIDVGVSGRTAQKVSEKLALIAKGHQVICITHLPQIAAMADTHFIIEKQSDGVSTKTSICQLDLDGSVQEIARILGGAAITDTVLKNAREMKQLADGSKHSA